MATALDGFHFLGIFSTDFKPPPPWFFTFSAFPFLYYLTDAANEAEMKAPSPFSLLKSETPKTLIERGAHAAYAQ